MSFIIIQLDKLKVELGRILEKNPYNKERLDQYFNQIENLKKSLENKEKIGYGSYKNFLKLVNRLITHASILIKTNNAEINTPLYKNINAEISALNSIFAETKEEANKLRTAKSSKTEVKEVSIKKKRTRPVTIIEGGDVISVKSNVGQELTFKQILDENRQKNIEEEQGKLKEKHRALDFYKKALTGNLNLISKEILTHQGFSNNLRLKQLKQSYEAQLLRLQNYAKQQIKKIEQGNLAPTSQVSDNFSFEDLIDKIEDVVTNIVNNKEKIATKIDIDDEQTKILNRFQHKITKDQLNIVKEYNNYLKLLDIYNKNKDEIELLKVIPGKEKEIQTQLNTMLIASTDCEFLTQLREGYNNIKKDIEVILTQSEEITQESIEDLQTDLEIAKRLKRNIRTYFHPSTFYKNIVEETNKNREEIKENIKHLLDTNILTDDQFKEELFKALEYSYNHANKDVIEGLKNYLNNPIKNASNLEINLQDLFPETEKKVNIIIMEQFHSSKKINNLLLNKRIEAIEGDINNKISIIEGNEFNQKEENAPIEEIRKQLNNIKTNYKTKYEDILKSGSTVDVKNKFSDEQNQTLKELTEIHNQILEKISQREKVKQKYDEEVVIPEIKIQKDNLRENIIYFYAHHKNEFEFKQILIGYLESLNQYDATKKDTIENLFQALASNRNDQIDTAMHHLDTLFLEEIKDTLKFHEKQLKVYQWLNTNLFHNHIMNLENKLSNSLPSRNTYLINKILEKFDLFPFAYQSEPFYKQTQADLIELVNFEQEFTIKKANYASEKKKNGDKIKDLQKDYIDYLNEKINEYTNKANMILNILNSGYEKIKNDLFEKADKACDRLEIIKALCPDIDEKNLTDTYKNFRNPPEQTNSSEEKKEPLPEKLLLLEQIIGAHITNLNECALKGENLIKSGLQEDIKKLQTTRNQLEDFDFGTFYHFKMPELKQEAEQKLQIAETLMNQFEGALKTNSKDELIKLSKDTQVSLTNALLACQHYNAMMLRTKSPLFKVNQVAIKQIENEYKRIYDKSTRDPNELSIKKPQMFDLKRLYENNQEIPKKETLDKFDPRLYILASLYQKLASANKAYQSLESNEDRYKNELIATIQVEASKISQYTDVIQYWFTKLIRDYIIKPLQEIFSGQECAPGNRFFKYVGGSKTEDVILESLEVMEKSITARNT